MNGDDRLALEGGGRAGARFVLAPLPRRASGAGGSRLGAKAGASLEFHDHREYEPGDDLRFLDWGVYGRTDRLVVKRYREEVIPHLDLLLDGSRSMSLPGTAKREALLGLAALLATAAANAGFTVAVFVLGPRGAARLPDGGGRPSRWEGLEPAEAGDPGAALLAAPPALRPLGVRLLVSDLLWPGEPSAALAILARAGAAAAVVELLGEADLEPPARGAVELVDAETGETRPLLLDDAARARYAGALRRHRDGWELAARQIGGRLVPLVAERVLPGFDVRELVARELLRPA